jgi:ubiquinone/menaquinone biosynthesis C-methylase UbiE
VKPGGTVAEIGAGRGEMTVLMAPKVGPAGRMYANEIDPDRLAEIRKRVANAGIGNVAVVTATATNTGLPADSCDAIYMIYVYHHLSDAAAYDRSIFRALRPGGALFIADFYPTWLLGGMGVPQPQLVEQLTAAGFQTVHVLTNCPPSRMFRQYCVLFRKPAR